MSVGLGDEAPDFTVETTEGPVKFHDWKGKSWAIRFSHPKDFIPVCTPRRNSRRGSSRRSRTCG
jgi:thioredoxin-dependent peroxiredoxin